MLIRVLNRGLFFRRGSQVDFTGGPLGDRRVNLEGADTATHTSGDGSKVRVSCLRGAGSANPRFIGIGGIAAESPPSRCEFYALSARHSF